MIEVEIAGVEEGWSETNFRDPIKATDREWGRSFYVNSSTRYWTLAKRQLARLPLEVF